MINGKLLRLNYREIGFVFLAFAVMVAAAYFSVGYILRNRLLNQANEMIATAEANVSSSLLGVETILLNSSHNIQNMIEQGVPKQEILENLITTTEWMRHRNEVHDRGLFDFYGIFGYINGEYIDGIGMNPDDDFIPQTRPWYQTGIRSGNKVGYTAPYSDWHTGDIIISATKNIIAGNDSMMGMLIVDIDIRQLMDYVNSLTIGQGGHGILISQNMTLMSYSDNTLLGSQVHELGGAYAEIAQTLRGGSDILGRRIKELDGSSSIVFFTDIFNGWYLGITIPYHMFYRDLYIAGIILAALGLTLSLLLCYILLRLSAARIRADEESKSKTSFLASMSHEIRTPMNAITGMAELVLRNELPPVVRGYVQDIKQAGANLISIINDILDISKIEAGKLEIMPSNYQLASLLNDTVSIINMRLKDKPIRFIANIDETIPNSLIGDEIRLRQILLNLLSNAVKYSEKGQINFSVLTEERNDKQIWLRITVADTGFGIKPEDIKNLFGDFIQVDTRKNRGIEGTGLGLAITKRLCVAMGGNISVESEYGKGSTFTVIIPQGIASPEPIKAMDFSSANQSDNVFTIKNTYPYSRILVVDDLPVNLKVVEGLLAPYKAVVDVCTSGYEAVELVKYKKFDLIFMDHMMPDMDGMETVKRIREWEKEKGLGTRDLGLGSEVSNQSVKQQDNLSDKNPVPSPQSPVPIIALTANAIIGMKEKFIENGFNDFLAKPIDIQKLDEMLDRWIGKKEELEVNNEQPGNDKLVMSNDELKTVVSKRSVKQQTTFTNNNISHSSSAIPHSHSLSPPVPKKTKYESKRFVLFSGILFFIISFIAIVAYSISSRQINKKQIEQQLAIASETIRLRLATTVNSELSLVLKMADTPIIRQYFVNPTDPVLTSLAQEEFALYEQHFKNKIVFWVNDVDRIFYSTGNEPYVVNPEDSESYWYNMTLYETERYNFNINYNPDIQQVNLWVNVPVFNKTEEIGTSNSEKKPIGMLGTGIDLTEFSEFVAFGYRELDQGITPYMFNMFNEITSSLDYDLVFNKVHIDNHLGSAGDELIKAAQKLSNDGSMNIVYNGFIHQISSISAMEWFLVVMHPIPGFFALSDTMNMIFFNMLFLIFIMFIVINLYISYSENAITEQNRQLIQANREAHTALQVKNDFLARVSHEILTPMNAITGMNELILRSEIPDEIRNYAQDIKQAGANLTSLINDILDFSETGSDKQKSIPANNPLTSLFNDAMPGNIDAGQKPPPPFSIKNVDVPRGIANTGSLKNYREVLAVLSNDAQNRLLLFNKMPQMAPAAESANQDSSVISIKQFITQVHALKSSLATIGATEISTQAAALEEAGKNKNLDLIKEKLPIFKEQLSELVQNINIALKAEA